MYWLQKQCGFWCVVSPYGKIVFKAMSKVKAQEFLDANNVPVRLVAASINAHSIATGTHKKFENNSSFTELIDVFEDYWRDCIFSPCNFLLSTPHGDVAAMIVLSTYFEAIAAYVSGESGEGRAREFFVAGFNEVYRHGSADMRAQAETIYRYVRCGQTHLGMHDRKVTYSRVEEKAFSVTYRKAADGCSNSSAEVDSISINPLHMLHTVEKHFELYLRTLRASKNEQLCYAFNKTANRR